MTLPKKITPDRIKQAIVEFRYSSKRPFEVLLGTFFNAMDDTYTYTNRPLPQPKGAILPTENSQGITLQFGGKSLFYNDKITVALLPNSIVFSCLNEYIGWETYSAEIERVILALNNTNVITHFTRVGIRYVSEYPNINLQECIKFEFTFGMAQVRSDSYVFRTEFNLDPFRIVLNLNNKVPVLSQSDVNQFLITPTSIIDIDVLADGLNTNDTTELFEVMNRAKKMEKEIFFGYLIREEFLKTLNPEY